MSESAKTLLTIVAMVLAFEVMKRIFGIGATLTVAMSALGFCIGALWAAGKAHPKEPAHD